MSRSQRYRRGHRAEWVAMLWLALRGYRPLARRYKTPLGEIDLILRRGRTLLFVEVKGRARHADAAEAVHTQNRQRVVRAAQWFLSARPDLADCVVRFDVCLVAWYRLPHHIPHAFDANAAI